MPSRRGPPPPPPKPPALPKRHASGSRPNSQTITPPPPAPPSGPASLRPTLDQSPSCRICQKRFGWFNRRCHCMNCGTVVCRKHVNEHVVLYHLDYSNRQPVCPGCFERLMINYSQVGGGANGSALWQRATRCSLCSNKFGSLWNKRHHCRNCGASVCDDHSAHRMVLYHKGSWSQDRVCDRCYTSLLEAGRRSLPSGAAQVPPLPPNSSTSHVIQTLQTAVPVAEAVVPMVTSGGRGVVYERLPPTAPVISVVGPVVPVN